jgi:hypothetical protein
MANFTMAIKQCQVLQDPQATDLCLIMNHSIP